MKGAVYTYLQCMWMENTLIELWFKNHDFLNHWTWATTNHNLCFPHLTRNAWPDVLLMRTISCFLPFLPYYSMAVPSWQRAPTTFWWSGNGLGCSRQHLRCLAPSNVQSGVRKCSIFLLNAEAIPANAFAPLHNPLPATGKSTAKESLAEMKNTAPVEDILQAVLSGELPTTEHTANGSLILEIPYADSNVLGLQQDTNSNSSPVEPVMTFWLCHLQVIVVNNEKADIASYFNERWNIGETMPRTCK